MFAHINVYVYTGKEREKTTGEREEEGRVSINIKMKMDIFERGAKIMVSFFPCLFQLFFYKRYDLQM